ncbi:DUF5686 family protein [candidate division KSB1 bacterium]
MNGIIKDAQTGEPLPYANIQIVNSNWGTFSNVDGRFLLVYSSEGIIIKVTYVGYASKVIKIISTTENLVIELMPKPIEGEMVVVYADRYTWAEGFILNAIKKKNNFKKKLSYYRAYTYTKTSIINTKPEKKIYILSEAVIKLGFISPEFYQEKILNLKVPSTQKHLPPILSSVNHKINIHDNKIKILNFSILSPLNDKALDYYNYDVTGQNLLDADTVVTISAEPKSSNKHLLRGSMIFNKSTHQLLEVNLIGGGTVKDGMFDSLKIYQKYVLKDSIFNMPGLTKWSLQFNVMGIKTIWSQEYSYIDYIINSPDHKPDVSDVNIFSVEPNLKYDVDFQRNERFKVPLSEEEKNFYKREEEIYKRAPFFIKMIPYLVTLPFDLPTSLGGVKINRISNWYHFNKIEGNYLGGEYQFCNTDKIYLYSQIGYSFANKLIQFGIQAGYKQFFLEVNRNITNLGNFAYVKSLHSLSALWSHEDNYFYYFSQNLNIGCKKHFHPRVNLTAALHFEQQKPVTNHTNFSIRKKDKFYLKNYRIQDYKKNYIGLTLNYAENQDYYFGNPVTYNGESFLNISLSYFAGNKKILDSSENRSIFNLNFHRFQSIYNPFSLDFIFKLHLQNSTDYLQEMNFLSGKQSLLVGENNLSFFTVNHYNYVVKSYLGINGDLTLFNFPQIYSFRMSAGGLISYLKPLEKIELVEFSPLNRDLTEYGLSVKGISFLSMYFVKNNINDKKIWISLVADF